MASLLIRMPRPRSRPDVPIPQRGRIAKCLDLLGTHEARLAPAQDGLPFSAPVVGARVVPNSEVLHPHYGEQLRPYAARERLEERVGAVPQVHAQVGVPGAVLRVLEAGVCAECGAAELV